MIDQITKILRRRSHYRAVFKASESTDVVLSDLRKFSRFGETPISTDLSQRVDPIATAKMIGRAEMFARITQFINCDDARLMQLLEKAQNDDE